MGVVETATFRLAPDTTLDEFLALDRRVQTELIPNQPGFVRRTTTHRDGEWLVVTLWASEAAAADYDTTVAGQPVQMEFDSRIAAGSLQRRRYDTLD